MEEEDLGFDGPDIRPPQASKGPLPGGGLRNFGRNDKDRRQNHGGSYGNNQRGSRNNPMAGHRDRPGGHRHGNGPGQYGSLGHRGSQNIHGRDIDKQDRKGGDLRNRLHQRREGSGNLDPNRHRDRDHRNRGDHRKSGGNIRNVTVQNSKYAAEEKFDRSGNKETSKDEELRRKRQQMEEETHRMEAKVRRKRERSKDRDNSRHTSHGTEKHHRTDSEHPRTKKNKKYSGGDKKDSVDILQAVDAAVAAADADQLRSGEEDVSSEEKEESGESEGSNQSSSSEEESGEEEESGSGTEQDGSGDTASEPGSQHTTPDNVSGEEIEHGEIVSSGDKHVERIEEGEEVSGDDEDTKNGESLEGSLSGQDRRSNNAERRSRHRKKHKQKTRSGDEMDQVAHGRWGRNEGSDVSDAPISEESESESLSNSRSEESRTPSRSPTPLRDPEERSQSQGSFADGIELVAGNDEKVNVVPIEDPRDKLPPYLPSVYGCRSVEEFQCMNRIEEGTYGVVYRARDKKTDEIVALKRLKMEREKEGFPITSLREINTLLISQHINVVTVREIVVGSNMDKIFIVMDFVEHDLKALMELMRKKKQVFSTSEIKCLMIQLLRAISHLHDNWILHRDIKSSNLLLSHNGILKVGDFGLAREYGSPLQAYTAIVVTLWYRAPELLLGIKEYSTAIDVWSCGCIFGELLLMNPLFPGESEVDELNRIFKLLGTPNEKIWPGYNKLPAPQKMKFVDYPFATLRQKFPANMLTESGMDLLKKFLTYDPKQRISCDEALMAEYFQESPKAIDPSMFPTWPAKSEMGAGSNSTKKAASPKPPSGGGAFKKINDDEDDMDNKLAGFALRGVPQQSSALWNLKF